MSIVRPFPARLVTPDRARRVVTAMSDTLDKAASGPEPAVDLGDYEESDAALYVYRQRGVGVAHTGVVCEVAMEAFVDGRVRGHEAVHPQRVEALVRHHATTNAPPALVTLLHRPGAGFHRTLDATCRTRPILDFSGPVGLRQTVWRVADEPTMELVTGELAGSGHYIADGHHRVAAGLEAWRLAGRPAGAGLLCVVHSMHDLRLSAFHRRVTGPVDPDGLLELLRPGFEVRAVPAAPTPARGSFGLYVDRRWFDVRYQGPRDAGPSGLDVAVLQARVLGRLVGSTPGPPHTIEIAAARTSVDELTQRCDADEGALFTLAPPPLETLTALADAGEVMPPKTTYFEPKPAAGIFLRP